MQETAEILITIVVINVILTLALFTAMVILICMEAVEPIKWNVELKK
jgi:hypothetical protein